MKKLFLLLTSIFSLFTNNIYAYKIGISIPHELNFTYDNFKKITENKDGKKATGFLVYAKLPSLPSIGIDIFEQSVIIENSSGNYYTGKVEYQLISLIFLPPFSIPLVKINYGIGIGSAILKLDDTDGFDFEVDKPANIYKGFIQVRIPLKIVNLNFSYHIIKTQEEGTTKTNGTAGGYSPDADIIAVGFSVKF
jgi:hypothetical protein